MAKRKVRKPISGNKQTIDTRWVYLILILLTFGLYANTLTYEYTLDDAILITENDFTKKGFSGLVDIFSHDTFRGFFKQEGKDKLVLGGRYRPLSQAVFAIEYAFFGPEPWIGHLANILWYVILICSIFYVVSFLFQSIFDKKRFAILFGSITALLFLSHPIHTEVVANIKGRDEIMALLGCIWSLYFSFRYFELQKIKYAFLAGSSLFLALLSKENAIAFVVIIPLTLFFIFSKNGTRIFRSSLPALIAAFFYLFIRFSILGFDLGQEVPLELMNNPFLKLVDGRYIPMSFNEKYPLVVFGILKYLQLLIFPHPLSHDYYPRVFEAMSWTSPMVVLGLLVILLLLGVVVLRYRKWPLIRYSILFFAVTIFLTSNILFPVGTHLSERFLFTPSLAFCLLFSGGVVQISYTKSRNLAIMVLLPIVFLYSLKTVTRNRAWKDNYTLFTTDAETSKGSAKVQNAAGGEIIAQAITLADTSARYREIQRAIPYLNRAIKIHPGYKNAFLLLGNASFYLNNYQEAITFYDKALQLDGSYPEALHNRALAYRDLGRFYGEKKGDLVSAIEFLQKAYTQLQDDYETNRLLGIAYGNQGLSEKAIPFFKKALALKTDDAWTNYNLGLAYLAIRDSINANLYIGKARTLNPEVGK